jgi:hypothetical protein
VIIQPAQSLKKCQDKCNTIQKLDVSIVTAIKYSRKKLLFCRINALPFPHRKYLTFFCRKGKHAGQEGKKSCFAFLYSILWVGRAGARLGCSELKTPPFLVVETWIIDYEEKGYTVHTQRNLVYILGFWVTFYRSFYFSIRLLIKKL